MPDPVPQNPRYTLAAWLFVAVVALVVVGGVVPGFSHGVTGVIGWAACALLWPRLTRTQTRIVLALLAVGIAGVAWGTAAGRGGLVERALAQNIPLIGMLIGVSFLQLISTSHAEDASAPDVGRFALLRTLLGVHLFGAVINFSSVAIFADRLSVRGRLSIEHACDNPIAC